MDPVLGPLSQSCKKTVLVRELNFECPDYLFVNRAFRNRNKDPTKYAFVKAVIPNYQSENPAQFRIAGLTFNLVINQFIFGIFQSFYAYDAQFICIFRAQFSNKIHWNLHCSLTTTVPIPKETWCQVLYTTRAQKLFILLYIFVYYTDTYLVSHKANQLTPVLPGSHIPIPYLSLYNYNNTLIML